jgi:PIN domain nuclease of toxin-antitoxin system
VRVLLDTHILLWWLNDPNRLPRNVYAVLNDPDNDVLFSVASIWELAIKASLRRPDFEIDPGRIVEAALDNGFLELPVRISAALRVATLPFHHRDPFDRLLVAQAITEPAIFYTADSVLGAYSELVKCI